MVFILRRPTEAKLRAQAADRDADDLSIAVVRDVRTRWAQAQDAHLEIEVAAKLVAQTEVALRLAKARYDAGLGSIVELNQAELSETSALIDAAGTRFTYLSARHGTELRDGYSAMSIKHRNRKASLL